MNSSLAANLNRISSSIRYYDNVIYLAIGVPLNLVNILVFTRLMRKKTNKTNMGFLGLCQSIVDITMLVYFSLVFRSTIFFGVSFYNTNDSLCKFINYFRRVLSTASSWIQVINTFGRFVYVVFGYRGRFRFMKEKRYLGLIILGVLILLGLANTNNLFYYWSNGTCTSDYTNVFASDMILICLRTYLPLLCMVVFNSFMIRIVFKKSRAALRDSSNKNRKEFYFTVSIIAMDVYLLILDLPLTIHFIFYDINLFSGAIKSDEIFAAKFAIFSTVARDMSLFIQTFTFFIYVVFNKLYRNEVLNLIGKVF